MDRSVRQLVEHVMCAIGDAERDHKYTEPKERYIRIGDAVIEALGDFGLFRENLEPLMNRRTERRDHEIRFAITEGMEKQREINRLNSLALEVIEIAKRECQFCGFLLKARDTFCCPECGWKV